MGFLSACRCVSLLQIRGASFRWCSARRSGSGISSSSKIGSQTTYFSDAHAPRSNNRQRSEQNGNSMWASESVGVLQMGQICFMAKNFFYHIATRKTKLYFERPVARKSRLVRKDEPNDFAVALLLLVPGGGLRRSRDRRVAGWEAV